MRWPHHSRLDWHPKFVWWPTWCRNPEGPDGVWVWLEFAERKGWRDCAGDMHYDYSAYPLDMR